MNINITVTPAHTIINKAAKKKQPRVPRQNHRHEIFNNLHNMHHIHYDNYLYRHNTNQYTRAKITAPPRGNSAFTTSNQ